MIGSKLKKYMGWCPNDCPVVGAGMRMDSFMDTVPSGCGELRGIDLSWWNRYRNQVMGMAVILTLVATVFSLLSADSSGDIQKGVTLGIIVGISVSLVTLWHSWKRYDRIDAGEFIEVRETKKQCMLRRVAMVIISIVYIGWMAFNAGTHLILATLVGLNILMWVIYFTVFVWEVRHHKAVIAKKMSMYTIDME
jgi:uncharacterized protein DUF1673